jgi:hypothetical protein
MDGAKSATGAHAAAFERMPSTPGRGTQVCVVFVGQQIVWTEANRR